MAKNYFSIENIINFILPAMAEKGFYKPSGTLGRHFLTVIKRGELFFIEGFNPSKEEGEKLAVQQAVESAGGEYWGEKIPPISKAILFPGWTLGYDCGQLWTICPPEMIKDPIRKVLRELKLPTSILSWVDDIYSVRSGEDDLVSASVIVHRSRVITDRCSMNYRWRTGGVYVLKGTDRNVVAKAIGEEFRNIVSEFGELSPLDPDLTYWQNNPHFVRVMSKKIFSCTTGVQLEFQTGEIFIDFNHAGTATSLRGWFKNDLVFTPNQSWQGRGYSGGHVSVGSNVATDEENHFMAGLILKGLKGRDLTTNGSFGGYYPKVEWEEI